MPPPNPLKPIQEALERVLHESGLHDFGRSMSSIDDLTAEVQHVYQRVDDIERVLETIVPILERLTVVFEDIHAELEPMSELASKIPGSGSRRRRRAKEGAALEAGRPAVAPPPPRGPGGPGGPSGAGGPGSPGVGAAGPGRPAGTAAPEGRGGASGHGPAGGTSAPGPGHGSSTSETLDGRRTVGPDRSRPGTGGTGSSTEEPPSSGGSVRPGATGYSPLGSRPRDDR